MLFDWFIQFGNLQQQKLGPRLGSYTHCRLFAQKHYSFGMDNWPSLESADHHLSVVDLLDDFKLTMDDNDELRDGVSFLK